MKRLKLNPSQRDKRRYFIVECEDSKKIEEAIFEYLGILGFAKASYITIKEEKNFLIGSCLRKELNDVLAALALKGLKVKGVSGTIKGLSRFFDKYKLKS